MNTSRRLRLACDLSLRGTARVAIVVALVVSAPLTTAADGIRECRSTLHGLYLFHGSGSALVGTAWIPKAIVEYIDFNDDGTLSVPNATLNLGGNIITTVDGSGTYTLDANCTGRIQFTPGPTFGFYVSAGKDLVMTQIGGTPAGVLQGDAERVRL